ncbi:MAG: N-acetyltransferase, partial [Firmicutes bacterium]|nr:N-acetyltransferase [Bacillota bacterium]
GLMLPSPAVALKKCGGHLLPFGWVGFFNALKMAKKLDMALVAVEPELKNSGIMTIIFDQAIRNALKNGIEYAETGPELNYNENVRALWKNFKHENHKERSAFLKKID